MPRHVLSLEEQAAGIRAALRSPATPRQFRAGLRKRLEKIESELGKRPNRRRVNPPKFLGWLRW
jgi:hypothetical protein